MTGAAAAPPAAPRAAGRSVAIGLLLGAVGAVLFSGKAIIVKLAYRYGVDPVTLIGLRMVYAAPLFALLAWASERRARAGAGAPPVWRAGDRWRILGLGLTGYYVASLLDFVGLMYVSVGLERVILYLSPTLVLLISLCWFRRPVSRRQWLALAVSYLGVVLVFVHDVSLGGERVVIGSLLVFGSAAFYAVYLSAAGELVRRLGTLRLTAWATLVACAACVLHALAVTGTAMWHAPWPVHWLSMLNGSACTFLPVLMVMAAIERIGSASAAQTGMIGPASTIVLGALMLDEPVGAIQLIGTAIVLFGVLMLSRVAS
ncbi:MAG: DMT family transporter, partial [Lautropia sp.]